MIKDTITRKIFFILLSLCLLSIVCVFPYIITIQGELLAATGVPLSTIFMAQLAQSALLFTITISLGLFFTRKIGFSLPFLTALLDKGNAKKVLSGILWHSLIMGFLTALSIYFLDSFFTAFGVGITTHQSYAPIWQKLLASTYGGVVEEVLMRLFLMSFFIWIGMKLQRSKQPSVINILVSMVLAAIIFGLGHLPITATLTQINSLVITRAIVLNGVGGIVFGILFWKKGLESAMLAHFTTDVFLLTILPLLLR